MNYTIILASGTGSRAGGDIPKLFVKVAGKTILEHTISVFEKNEMTDKIILVTNKEYFDFCSNLKFPKKDSVVLGGKRRQDSSREGVFSIKNDNDKVLIHDGARPYVTNEIINACFCALERESAVLTAVECSDTIFKINENNIVEEAYDRKTLVKCQTPQGFRVGLIKKAHTMAQNTGLEVTDDAGLVVRQNLGKVLVVQGSTTNLKITYPEDIEAAKSRLFR